MDPTLWMNVGEGRFYLCDAQLRMSADDTGSSDPPKGWDESDQAQEEVLETLVILNLHKLLAEDVSFLFRAGDYWGLQDITAIDRLGRLHLMELKKDKIDAKVTEQLAAYLLRTMFDDGVVFAHRMASLNRKHLEAERWAVYLAGVLANERTTVVGPKAYRTHVSDLGFGEALTDHEWKQQTTSARLNRQCLTLLEIAAGQGRGTLSLKALHSWAEQVLQTSQPPAIPAPPFRIRCPNVIWLIGRRVDEAALEQVRMWRRAGVDARPLVVDARRCRQTGRWMLRVLREDFPERAALIRHVAVTNETGKLPKGAFRATNDQPTGYELELKLYETLPPSSPKLKAGGAALGKKVKAFLYDNLNEEPVKIWSAKGLER